MKRLLSIVLSLLVATMLFCTTYASGTEQKQTNSNETGNNYNQQYERGEVLDRNLVVEISKFDADPVDLENNMYSNPRFIFYDNQSGIVNIGLHSFWKDTNLSCKNNFKCTSDFSTSWKNNTSFQLSTTDNTSNTWSLIQGLSISVNPNEFYKLVTHMKLNDWATQSHVTLEGFNETSTQWYQITQCPSGINGPMEWREFNCNIIIPENTTKIRPVLNAGWSSEPKMEGTTWFDSFYMTRNIVADPNLEAEVVSPKLEFPTGMAFLDPNDILVLEKDKGTVQRIVNGVKLREPLLNLDVRERDGLLAISIEKNMTTSHNGTTDSTYVFLYFTAAEKKYKNQFQSNESSRNHLYRYEFVNNSLINPKLLLDLPAGFIHNGAKILIGHDKYLYLIVGDLRNRNATNLRNSALNYLGEDGNEPDGRGGILRIHLDGRQTTSHDIFGDKEELNKYYAYGIRNSFGMDVDPLTGKLWDTENGPEWGDEINLVEPGFNSGWNKVQGIWTILDHEKKGDLASEEPDNLVDFDGRGKYSSPEFTWNNTVGPTALKFLSTDKLGKQYENDMLVADVNNDRIYHFELNQNRTALDLEGPLIDKVADSDNELDNITFAKGFDGIITDMEIGPDGYLYVVADQIYRIAPIDQKDDILTHLTHLDNISKMSLLLIREIL